MEYVYNNLFWYFLAFGLILLAVGYIYEKKRSEALLLMANSLGLSFDKSGRDSTFQAHNDFYLFSQGHGRKIKNEMWGELDGLQISIFGYQYTEGSGRNASTYKQTALSIECNSKELPSFVLRPENFIHKIGQIFGYKDIDFDLNVEFSKSYLLRGDNEDEIRKLFTKDVLSYFELNKSLCIELKNNILLFYRDSKRCKPNEIKKFCSEGTDVYKVIFSGESFEFNKV